MQPMLKDRRVVLAFLGGTLVGGALAYALFAPGSTRIVLTHLPEDANIYLDNEPYEAGQNGRLVLDEVPAGAHTLLVAADGFWPWAKTVEVQQGDRLEFGVLSLAIDPQLRSTIAVPENPERARQVMTELPTKDNPAISDDHTTALWMEGDTMYAAWQGKREAPRYFCTPVCSTTRAVFTSDVAIRSLGFYGDRSDVLLFAAENGIFGLELDARGTQNFQPLYLGTAPLFSVMDKDTLLVYDPGETQNGFFGVKLH